MQVSSKQLLKPKSITITPLATDNNNCKIVMEPFERGFGHTLGTVSYTHLDVYKRQA